MTTPLRVYLLQYLNKKTRVTHAVNSKMALIMSKIISGTDNWNFLYTAGSVIFMMGKSPDCFNVPTAFSKRLK